LTTPTLNALNDISVVVAVGEDVTAVVEEAKLDHLQTLPELISAPSLEF
jgi:hypothetical protein